MAEAPLGGLAGMMSIPKTRPLGAVRLTATLSFHRSAADGMSEPGYGGTTMTRAVQLTSVHEPGAYPYYAISLRSLQSQHESAY